MADHEYPALIFTVTPTRMKYFWITFLFFSSFIPAKSNAMQEIFFMEDQSDLMQDLMIVDCLNKVICERFPVTYDHLLQGGYFNMPSARMGEEGELAIGYSSVPPYSNYNARAQLLSHLELSFSYRVFRGVDDPILSQHGFGDLSDKGANFKVAFLLPEDSDYELPGFAFGMEDIHGTRNFKTSYFVFTKVFLNQNFEVSLGYGWHRISGVFGGISWMPFRKCCYPYFENISLVAEYDAINYKSSVIEPHPKGRKQKFPVNFGIKYRLWDSTDFSLSCVRGNALAFSVSTYYNFGTTDGFLPKIDDELPYVAPVNTQCLGWLRPEEVMLQDFLFAFDEQGFDMLEVSMAIDSCGKTVLRLRIYNPKYRLESEVRCRLNNLLSALTPSNIDQVIVVIDALGFPIQEYRYKGEVLSLYEAEEVGEYELDVLTPLAEVSFEDPVSSLLLYKYSHEPYDFFVLPRTHTFFGSSTGKFKYSLGVSFGSTGFIFDTLYYSLQFGVNMISNLNNISDIDMLNPSQIINVRTDVVNYYKKKGLILDQAYLQKNWNMGCGWYSRVSGGYFEQEYGGLTSQVLYYPVNSNWAIGLEAALLFKRRISGLLFTETIRKLNGFTPTFQRFIGSQFFLDIYYDWEPCNLDFEVSIGKFLANDFGARFLVSRYFESGLRLSLWYTLTNANDLINGKTYHDKGFEFSMPLDIFYTHSSRERWQYGMSAWLRDSGFRCETGQDLFMMINDLRQ